MILNRHGWLLMLVWFMILTGGATATAAESVTIDYYYGNTCSHCAEIKPFLDTVEKNNPQIRLNRIEVFANRDNAAAMHKAFDRYGVPRDDRGVPAILINDKFLIGSDLIVAQLERELTALPKSRTPLPPQPALPLQTTIFAVTGAALVDSINPCAIFVLIVLLSSLLVMKEPGDRQLFLCAAAFIVAVYLAYFLLGVGLLYAVDWFGLSTWLYRGIGFLAILIGLFNLKDGLFYGAGGFVMEIPQRWRPALLRLLMKVTTPAGAFFAGLIVTLFEAPCTGGPYLFAIGLLAQDLSWVTVVPLLLYYNFIFILPLIGIAALVIGGKLQIDKAEAWQRNNIRRLHLTGGLIMLGLGLWMLLK